MFILGIETATDVGSVAVVEAGVLRGQVIINQRFAQSRNLVQSIDFLLKSLALRAEQLTGIAVSLGPGSYTGLRIGLSVAKSLAYVWNKPLLAVNSLDALAQQGRHQTALICPVIRFRRHEYYNAIYAWDSNQVQRQSDYQVRTLAQLIEEIHQPVLLLGILRLEDQQFIESVPSEKSVAHGSERMPEAAWVAILGEQNLEHGVIENISGLTPFYMHDFPIRG